MIWSFHQLILDDYNSRYFHGEHKTDWVKSEHTFYNPITKKMEETYEMVDKNPGGHWYDSDGLMLHEQRVQEGLELFGKYYRNLWD
jgi:hypothetical protein